MDWVQAMCFRQEYGRSDDLSFSVHHGEEARDVSLLQVLVDVHFAKVVPTSLLHQKYTFPPL